ncbi:MAG: hypothetical protein V1667_00475, partial [bacterium]
MKDFFGKKTWMITVLMLAVSFSLSIAVVYYEFSSKKEVKTINASAANNTSGYAWSSNVGWVSFNCVNDSPACGTSNYGVSIDLASKNFSGYAWSSNVGWISFSETNPPDNYAFNSNCPSVCNSSNSCTACYNSSDGKVYGWGKILSMGSGGWIKLNGTWSNGVSIDGVTGNFSGWAWNANDDKTGIGWVSFNCSNESPACASSNYKVVGDINSPPSASGLNAHNWSFSQAAQYGALKAKLGWIFSDPDAGQSEYAYQIIANTSNSIVSPVFDSGQCLGYNNPTSKCKIDAGVDQFPLDLAMALNYNTAYYWWVKVWDNNASHKSSSLVQYNSAIDTPAEADDGSPLTFTTYKHEMPIPDFTYFPNDPSKGEQAEFTNKSKVYLSSAPSTAIDCSDSLCSYLWTATAGASINDAATTSPIIIFNSSGNCAVTLKVTDNDGYYVS